MSRWETTSSLEARVPPDGGCRLVNSIYLEGPLAALWRRVLGPRAARSLPGAQRAVVELAQS